MTNKKLDLNKLRDEIDNEKKKQRAVPSQLGGNVVAGSTPRDTFLSGLLASYNSGQPTVSTNLIKVVENKVAENKGENRRMNVNETKTVPASTHRPMPAPVKMGVDREEQIYRDFNNINKKTLAESIEAFQGKTSSNSSSTVNFNGQQYLTSMPNNVQQNTGMPTVMNEEVVRGVVNNYLAENLGPVFEEAIKGTIIEMYAVERIKEVLNENRDLIKSVVVETIREIQARNKAKTQ